MKKFVVIKGQLTKFSKLAFFAMETTFSWKQGVVSLTGSIL